MHYGNEIFIKKYIFSVAVMKMTVMMFEVENAFTVMPQYTNKIIIVLETTFSLSIK